MSTTTSPGAAVLDRLGCLEPDPARVPLTDPLSLARRLMRARHGHGHGHPSPPVRRRQRERIPADKKDATYWMKRRRNNEAARRSRERRKLNDLMLEGHLLTLSTENAQLRAQLLNLRYHSGLSAHTNHAPFAQTDETSAASVRPPHVSVLPMHAHSPAPLPAGFWGNSPQETAMPRLERMMPRFSVGVFDPSLPGPSGPRGISHPEGALGGRRSAEAELNAQRQVSSSDDVCSSKDEAPQLPSPIPAFLPAPDALRRVPVLPRSSPNWLLPYTGHPAVCGPNNFLVNWRPSYLPPPPPPPGAFRMGAEDRRGPRFGAEAHMERQLLGPQHLGLQVISEGR